MERQETIDALKNYFKIHELVGPAVYHKYKNDAWYIFTTELLETLLVIRQELDKPITINDWYWGGMYDERGYRDNVSPIMKGKTEDNKLYLSGHVLGCAVDFDVKGMSPDEVRFWIIYNQDVLPHKVRLEYKKNGEPITWVHLDTKYYEDNDKVHFFDV